MRVPVALGLILVLAQAPIGTGQDKPRTPVFGARTDLVLVDFVVTGKDNRAVTGLSAKDFVVKEDGKVRPIASFLAFEAGAVAADAGPAEVVVEPFPSATPETRALALAVIFVDDGQMSPQEAVRLRPALKKLIATLADKNGALALIAPWSKIQIADQVEGNRAVFSAAVDKINGRRAEDRSSFPIADAEAIAIQRGDPAMLARVSARFVALNPGLDGQSAAAFARSRANEVAQDARARREDAYGVLLEALDWMIGKPGRHSVVMVSGGFAFDSDESRRQQEVVTRSLRANAPIHFVDARGLSGMSRFQSAEFGQALDRDAGETPFAFSEASEGSINLADDTGGLVIRNTNDMSRGFARLVDMTTTYYVLGYEPPEHKKAGFRKIKVEALTKGLKVIARRGYFDEAPAPR